MLYQQETKSKISDFPTTWALSSVTGADDLKAIEALTGTSGFLKKTAANTWSLDTNTYVTSSGVTSITLTQGTGISIGSSGTAITSTGTRTISLADNYGDTKNPYASKTARYVLAAPAAQAGAPTFRALTKDDVGLNNVLNYAQITAIGQGDNGTLRVWTGDPTSTNTNDYEDIALTITAYSQSTVSKAAALNLSAAVGSTSKPVYFKADGKPYEISYTIEKSVPSNAVFTDTTYNFADSYNASSNKGATVATVTNAINNLDVTAITGTTGQTITSISETNGKISATYSNISITKSQISDFPSTMTPAAHTHDDRYYTETEIDNKFTALTNTTTQINHIKFYSGVCNAGKTYIGWIKIASYPMSSNNLLGQNSYDFGIYREYNSPSSESYNIKINIGWNNASIVQLNGKAGTQIIEKFRLVKDNTNHICYFEMYVNTNYTTYQNNVNLRIQKWTTSSVELTLLNTVQTEADSDFQIVSTLDLKPQGIVSNSNFYGNLIGNADTASAVAWNNITSKPINFITNTGALNTNGWKTLGGRNTQSSIAISYATSNPATWNSGSFSSSIVFGCQDTKGMVDVGYVSPIVTFGGGSVNGSTNDAPKWYFKLNGTSEQSYTFPTTSKTLAATDGSNASGNWGISITGNASTATEFSSNATVTLTGDTTGTSTGSKKSWSIATTTNQITSSELTNQDLNNYKTLSKVLFYYGGGSNTVLNKPSGINQFGVFTYNTAAGHVTQELSANNRKWIRFWNNSTWSNWQKFITDSNYTDYTVTKTGTGASGDWDISITGNAATASRLRQNTEMTYGWSGINYFNISAANQSAAKVNDTPFSSATWTHILRFNHANNSGYYTDLAVPFNANSLYYKRISAGSLLNASTNGGWVKILDQLNYTDYTVKKDGTGASGSWGISVTGTASNVTGTVAIANGGTGKTTTVDAINNLLGGLPVWSANPSDSTYFIRQDTGGAASYGKVPFSTLWNYIKSKSDSTYVTLDTAQTISGTKTFTGGISMKSSTTTNACNINYNTSLSALVFSFV